jgi:type II secretory pathway component PulK
MRNEHGIALVITLLVVALLTIIVVEFTYSAEVDAHMARNALNALQASLLARSGVNLGEAFLLHDDDPQVDSYTEDWGNMDLLNSQLILPDNMRLRVRIVDEGGKLNINLTRPRTVQQWLASVKAAPNSPPTQLFQFWTTDLGNLLGARGAPPDIADAVTQYWSQLFQIAFPGALAGQAGVGGNPYQGPTAVGTPTPGGLPNNPFLWDFPSLDDASVIPGLTPSLMRRSRAVLTAIDSNRQPQVNINTAPAEVLSAIIPDAGVVDNIISQRQDQGLKQSDLGQLLAGLNTQDPAAAHARIMLGVRSSFFLIRASAIVNPNPITGKGGISRSASMLVRRDPRAGVAPNAAPGTPRWTLTQLDWQKEGGAVLFQERTDQEPGAEDLPNAGLPGTGG